LQGGTVADDKNMMKQIKLQLHYTYSQGTDLGAVLYLEKNKEFTENLVEPSLQLILALCKAADISESQKIANATVNVFEHYKKTLLLLKTVIHHEVDGTSREGVLFRSNSMAMKMVSIYARLVGHSYLQETLGPVIKDICNDKRSVEVDPLKVKPNENLEENNTHLADITENLLQRIIKSIDQCPMEIRTLCNYFMVSVREKFPNHWGQAVGGFIFLRFFCPACVAPDGYNIIPAPPSESSRRALVLVAKTLQNLSNGLMFTKEDFMTHMNEFIDNNKERVNQYFEQLSTLPSTPISTEQFSSVVIPPSNALQDLFQIHHYLNLYHDKIAPNVSVKDLRAMLNRFKQVENSAKIQKLHTISSEQLKKRGALKIIKKMEGKKEHKIKPRDVLDFVGLGQLYSNYQEDEIVLNYDNSKERHSVLTEGLQSPCDLSVELLSKIFHLYVKHSYKDQKTNSMVTNWEDIGASEDFKLFLAEAETLRWVDLLVLSDLEKLAFFMNISNIMVLHIHVVAGPPIGQLLKDRSTSFFNQFRYKLGDYTYSLNMIKHGILRGNPKSGISGRIFQRADRRNQFTIKKVDPRIHFALSNLTISSPYIRAYLPATLEEQLQLAGVLYCQKYIQVEATKKEISLPEIFHKYLDDFGKGDDEKELLTWIFQYLNEKQRMELIQLIEKRSYHIIYSPFNWEPQVQDEDTQKLVRKPIYTTSDRLIMVNAW